MHPWEDLDDFFTDDLAIPITCPSGAELFGIFTDASSDDSHGQAVITMRAADIDREALSIGAQVSLVRPSSGARVAYKVEGRQSDGTGVADVLLREVA